jgi:SAM-dependent methyltransferase
MAGWGAGYITDVSYIPGYFVHQSPVHMVAAARLAGVACDLPDDDREPVHYLELGCGLGFGALILAASNPVWRITAIDFNPAHIAIARALARQAGIGNATFIEADLATLAGEPAGAAIPEADFVSAHGLWSWVSPAVRQGIVRLLRAKVRAGGMLHLSYNALPGWQGVLGAQRLVRAAGLARPGRSDRQAAAGFEVLRALHAAGARHLAADAQLAALMRSQAELSPAYLAHEFMNTNWAPAFHADVAADLAEAKLDWVGSANPLENFPAFTLTAAQRKVYDGIDDPLERELVKDLCLARAHRDDLFVRGAQRLGGADGAAALREIVLLARVAADEFRHEIAMAEGKLELSRPIYGAVMGALARGPRSVGELLALPETAAMRDNPAELLGVMLGTDQAAPVLRPDAPLPPAAAALNRILAGAFGAAARQGPAVALASARLGAGLPAGALEMFVHDRVSRGEDLGALEAWTASLGAGLEVARWQQLRDALTQAYNRRLPVFRAAGVVPD